VHRGLELCIHTYGFALRVPLTKLTVLASLCYHGGMKTPGERLREAREAKGLTREALAARVGCCVSTLRNYEYGAREPRPDIRQRIQDVLDAIRG
jgi:DNA-binding transcriptional regulator YiaG